MALIEPLLHPVEPWPLCVGPGQRAAGSRRAWLSACGRHWLAWSQSTADEIEHIRRTQTDRAWASKLVADVLRLEELKQLGN